MAEPAHPEAKAGKFGFEALKFCRFEKLPLWLSEIRRFVACVAQFCKDIAEHSAVLSMGCLAQHR